MDGLVGAAVSVRPVTDDGVLQRGSTTVKLTLAQLDDFGEIYARRTAATTDLWEDVTLDALRELFVGAVPGQPAFSLRLTGIDGVAIAPTGATHELVVPRPPVAEPVLEVAPQVASQEEEQESKAQ